MPEYLIHKRLPMRRNFISRLCRNFCWKFCWLMIRKSWCRFAAFPYCFLLNFQYTFSCFSACSMYSKFTRFLMPVFFLMPWNYNARFLLKQCWLFASFFVLIFYQISKLHPRKIYNARFWYPAMFTFCGWKSEKFFLLRFIPIKWSDFTFCS